MAPFALSITKKADRAPRRRRYDMTRIAYAALPILALKAGLCVLAILGGANAVLIAVLLASGILTW